MKKFSYILSLVLLLLPAGALLSQTKTSATLPLDPRVKNGKLTNGLSYIIVKNQAQKATATFCVAQKVGTSLETGGNRGSFMLLQQLATKGTRNFAGSAIPDYLKSLGLTSDAVTFQTGQDRVTYAINDLPISRSNTIDSALLILYNWMSSINVDEEDIAAERSTLAGRILNGWSPLHRMDYALLRDLYPDSPYINEIQPSEVRRSVNAINSRDLRNFYYDWCRPELQCVIVVGDVDLAKTETQIKSVFSTIPKPLNGSKRTYYTPKEFKGVKTLIMQDDEYGKTSVSINYLKQPLKDEYKNTNLPYIQDFLDFATIKILVDRINEGVVRENLPLYNLEVGEGKFMGIEKSNAYTIRFETLPSTVYSATTFVGGVLKKLFDQGAYQQEFTKAVDLYWKSLENLFDTRAVAGNDLYLERALEAYYDGYSLASTEMHFEIMKQVLFSLNLKQLNSYISALLSQEDNIVISCYLPKADGVNQISKERLLSAFSQPLDKSLVAGESTLPVWPNVEINKVATVVSETEDARTGVHTLLLSNGATLLFKETASPSDTLYFRAFSKGGFSLMKGVNIGNQEFFNDVLDLSSIADVSYANMDRLYSYNHMNLESRINQNTERMDGFAIPTSAEKLMQAIYLNMTDLRPDDASYQVYKMKVLNDLKFNSLSPQEIFKDSVTFYNNSNKQFVAPLTEEQIEAYDYSKIHAQLKERFSNAADFVFVFAGKSALSYKDLAVKYIGAIPSDKDRKENWLVVPNYPTKGHKEKRFLAKMNVPRTYVSLTLSCAKKADMNNYVLSQLTKIYVENIFKDVLHNKVPLFNVNTALSYYPENIFTLKTIFETDSSEAHGCIDQLIKSLEKASKNITDSEFAMLEKSLKEQFSARVANGSYWLDMLESRYMASNTVPTDAKALLTPVTKKELSKFIKDLISSNRITVIMDGTTADIPTQKLLQENEFIRNFFNVD